MMQSLKRMMVVAGVLLGLMAGSEFLCSNAYAQSWSALDGGPGGWVYAVAVYQGQVVAGGTFAGGAKIFDGVNWSVMGGGIDGEVRSLCVFNNELYAGGSFLTSNGGTTETSYVARWDGSAWIDPDGGVSNGPVWAMTVYQDTLVVAGYFSEPDGPGNYIAYYDGSDYWPLGSGLGGSQGQVMAVGHYGNELVAAGFFTTAGGAPASHIAKWNGTSWSTLGSGIGHIVYALTEYNGSLIAGGLFGSAGGNPAQDVAAWDGTNWSALGSGVYGGVYGYCFALTTYQNKLVAGGIYEMAGEQPAGGIAEWDGANWTPMGTGAFNSGSLAGVFALTNFNGDPVAGGIFNSMSSVNCGHIARWSAPPALTPVNDLVSYRIGDQLLLTWSGRGNPMFHVYEDLVQDGLFTNLVSSTPDTFALLPLAPESSAQRFYLVRAADQ